MDETADQAPPEPAAQARPARPTTPEELRRSLTILRTAIAVSVVTIAVLTWAFVALLDAPTVPLVPLAVLVIGIDLAMLVIFTRQRRRAIEEIERRDSGIPG